MTEYKFLFAGNTPALTYAMENLRYRGCTILDTPDSTATHLILPVPGFESDGSIKGGGALSDLLAKLPDNIIIFGGNLNHPSLSGYQTVDFLKDPLYLSENAAITAHCALKLALANLTVTLQDCPVLVVGWGRIGKCLAALLKQIGARVCVSARKESDRAILSALGYETMTPVPPAYGLMRYRVIFNTVPEMVLPEELTENCLPQCLKMDLASIPGIAGEDVLVARGLPNKEAPESSGRLIAKTVIRFAGKEY